MPLTEIDRQLIGRCLEREPEAWCEFVDRYLGVVFHVIQHTAHMRGMVLHADDAEDLAADVMSTIVDSNFKVLRRFRGKSSMASYLAVIARRVVVNKLSRRAIYEKKMHGAKIEQEGKQSVPPSPTSTTKTRFTACWTRSTEPTPISFALSISNTSPMPRSVANSTSQRTRSDPPCIDSRNSFAEARVFSHPFPLMDDPPAPASRIEESFPRLR